MALSDKLTAIANAIRKKNGKSDKMNLTEMAAAIDGLGGSENLPVTDFPSYVKDGALEVAKKVDSVKTDSSIIFLTFSDPHQATDESTGWKTNIGTGNKNGCQAMKALTTVIPFDFALFLGDLTYGYKTTTQDQFVAQCQEFHSWVDESLKGIPQIWTMGNHDTGEYYAAEEDDLSCLYDTTLLKQYFSDYSDGAVYWGDALGDCYRDFTSKKIRVINLNTVYGEIEEGENARWSLSSGQRAWFAQTLYDLGSKSDASSWGFIIMGHYPLDWGYTKDAGDILNAYLLGKSITISATSGYHLDIDSDVTVNFSGHNAATCYGNFHGHLHNYKTSKIYVIPSNVSSSNPPTTQMDVWRVCCPSMNYYRTNEVGDNGRLDSNQIEFGDEDTPAKSSGVTDTAFTVNVINPSEKMIYSFAYGAGYDRTLSFDFTVTMYSIKSTLTKCSISNATTAVEKGKSYTATLTVDTGYSFDSVVITMGGKDVTSFAYSNGKISISSVTGNVVITAVASKPVTYHNLVNDAVNSSGTGEPYQDGYAIASSGSPSAYGSNYTCTGFMPISSGTTAGTYRIAGDGIAFEKTEEYARVAWYDSSFALLKTVIASKRLDSSQYYPTTVEESTTAMTFIVTTSNSNVPTSAAYFRVSAVGKGANLIVTIDEEID